MNSFAMNPVNLVRTLTAALDLAVNGVNKHQLRTAVIAQYMAETLEIDAPAQQTLVCASLMHDIGAAPDLDERVKLLDPHQEALMGPSIHLHAEKGYHLLKDSVFADAALPVLHHHDAWEGGNPSGASHEAIPLASRIIHIADRVDVKIHKDHPVLEQSDAVRQDILGESGKKFDPALVDAFILCSKKECFWLDLVNPAYMPSFLNQMSWGVSHFSAKEVLGIAKLYATLIDRMSRFMATHSRSVSRVAVLLASQHGYCENELDMMRVAGLLHDIGKLSVPNSILEKPGKLDLNEMRIMRQHTYHTYRILEQIENWKNIAEWAAFHHETLDGTGYPFKLESRSLPLGSRIMAAADIFVALAEDRPYRAGLDRKSVERVMRNMVDSSKIDGYVVDSLFDVYHEADAIVHAAPEIAD